MLDDSVRKVNVGDSMVKLNIRLSVETSEKKMGDSVGTSLSIVDTDR